jgi:hypothetical protein
MTSEPDGAEESEVAGAGGVSPAAKYSGSEVIE